jgi:hypothetical protein
MVKRLFPAALSLLLMLMHPPALGSEAALELELDRVDAELGRSVHVRLTARGTAQPLDAIDLSALAEDFAVDKLSRRTGDTGEEVSDAAQTLTLVLRPRRAGMLTVPALSLDGLRSVPQALSVRPAGVDDGVIDPLTQVSSMTVWQRQQVMVSVEIRTPQPFASLEAEPWAPAGFEVVPLPASRERGRSPDHRLETLRMGWALYPLNGGVQTVELPQVRYVRNGVAQRVFALPLLHLQVRDLPIYVPPTLPVGSVELASSLGGPFILRTGALVDWRIRLSSDELPPWRLPAVLKQVRSDGATKVFSARSERSMAPDPRGVHGEAVHHVPMKPLRSGLLNLPPLRVQYFDPHSGRLIVLTRPGERRLALGPWWLLLLGTPALLGTYMLLRRGWRWWHLRQRRRSQRREALAQLSVAETPEEIRAALMRFGGSENWPLNITLGSWLARWRAQFVTDPDLENAVLRLSTGCYDRRSPIDCEALRGDLLGQIRASRRHRRAPWFYSTT